MLEIMEWFEGKSLYNVWHKLTDGKRENIIENL